MAGSKRAAGYVASAADREELPVDGARHFWTPVRPNDVWDNARTKHARNKGSRKVPGFEVI